MKKITFALLLTIFLNVYPKGNQISSGDLTTGTDFMKTVIKYGSPLVTAVSGFNLLDLIIHKDYAWKNLVISGGCLVGGLVGSYFTWIHKARNQVLIPKILVGPRPQCTSCMRMNNVTIHHNTPVRWVTGINGTAKLNGKTVSNLDGLYYYDGQDLWEL